jgi:uncharacterized protein
MTAPMALGQAALLFSAGVIGGTLNSIAGGGSFITFPALVFAGVPTIAANATNTIVVWPAGVASSIAYRRELELPRLTLVALSAASLVGGVAGAMLLLRTEEKTFARMIPWLLLVASTLFTFGGGLAARLPARAGRFALPVATVAQLVISVYGGYFGAGMGFMMLAMMTLLGIKNIHTMNAARSVLGTFINGVAVVAFILARAVDWARGAVMVVGATAGAYAAAAIARRTDPKWIRRIVLVCAWGLTAYFFVDVYVRPLELRR